MQAILLHVSQQLTKLPGHELAVMAPTYKKQEYFCMGKQKLQAMESHSEESGRRGTSIATAEDVKTDRTPDFIR